MKREIIFRGKRLDNGKWEYGDWVHDDIGGMYVFPNDAENLYIEYRVDPETVGQYTGLTDKNGKRIFEGDILKVYYYGKSKIFGVVKFDESRFFIDDDFMRDDIKAKVPMTEMFSRYEFEVVGNVHDNPELLKGDSHEQNT